MRFHVIAYLLASLVAFLPLLAVEEAEAKPREWYRKHGVTVVAPPGSAPMTFVGLNGQPSGYIVDVWNKWSEETGVPVRFVFEPWPETLSSVGSEKYDIHSGLFFNEEREAYLDFSTPYHALDAALIVPKDVDADLDTILRTYAIGALDKGYASYFMEKTYPSTKIKTYATTSEIARGLVNGEVQGVVGDHPILGYEIGKLGMANKLVVKKILYNQALYAATAKGREALLGLMNDGFAAIDEAEHDVIVKRWFVNEVDSKDWTAEIALALLILCIGLGALLYFDRLNFRRG